MSVSSVSWLFNLLYDFHNTYQNLRFGSQYAEHFFASAIKIALRRLFETATKLEQEFPKRAVRMPTDPRPDLGIRGYISLIATFKFILLITGIMFC